MIHDLTVLISPAGLGRAPLTILGYLITSERLDLEAAIRLILAGRPGTVHAWEA